MKWVVTRIRVEELTVEADTAEQAEFLAKNDPDGE